MKKFLVMILFMFLLTGCSEEAEKADSKDSDIFVCIQAADYYTRYYDVVYHKDTKVMYTVSKGTHNQGGFTLLVNPDGTPMIYEPESEDEE